MSVVLYFSCSAQTTITHLKKFISLKLFETLDRFREVTATLLCLVVVDCSWCSVMSIAPCQSVRLLLW